MNALALLWLSGCLHGDVTTLDAAKDNTLYFSIFGIPLSNGQGEHTFIGTNASLEPRRALLAFDLSPIPPGSTITAITLDLTMSKTLTGPQPAAIHRILRDWGEGPSDALLEEGGGAPAEPGDATWDDAFFPGTTWATPGGDSDPNPSAAPTISAPGHYLIGTPAMVADVQHWLDHPTDNFGWIIVGNESVGDTAKRFDTREHIAPGNRPKLTIEFTPPCKPDCERDADLDIFDVLCFQGLFADLDPYGDYEEDGDWDVFDFLAFQNDFAAGC